MNKEQCTEDAKILIAWGGKLYNFCPAHANGVINVANAIGAHADAQRLPELPVIKCGSFDKLSEEQKELNKQFQ